MGHRHRPPRLLAPLPPPLLAIIPIPIRLGNGQGASAPLQRMQPAQLMQHRASMVPRVALAAARVLLADPDRQTRARARATALVLMRRTEAKEIIPHTEGARLQAIAQTLHRTIGGHGGDIVPNQLDTRKIDTGAGQLDS